MDDGGDGWMDGGGDWEGRARRAEPGCVVVTQVWAEQATLTSLYVFVDGGGWEARGWRVVEGGGGGGEGVGGREGEKGKERKR